MKRIMAGVGLLVALTVSAPGWKPSGWVYANYPYMYDHALQDWYWFSANNAQWANQLTGGGGWFQLNAGPLAYGWTWHTGRYAYHWPTQTWHYFSANGRHKCVNLRTGIWSVFTVPAAREYMVVDLSAGPAAANYPVQYFTSPADVPDGVTHDRYKTTHLLLRRLPAGAFTMGSPTDEVGRAGNEAQRAVTLTSDFFIGVFEVTQRQWERVMGIWPSHFSNVAYRESRPVEWVSWDDVCGGTWPGEPPGSGQPAAGSFVRRIRDRTGLMFNLPTEAQWEYACRAGTTTSLNSGKNVINPVSCWNFDELGRYEHNHPGGYSSSSSVSTDGGTARVGGYLPNAWGLYDMHGNVWEWCLDWYEESPLDWMDPLGAATGSLRVVRSGGWDYDSKDCRSANRSFSTPSVRNPHCGFRLAQIVPN